MSVFDGINFPFFTLQQLNLDWLLKEVKRIAGFMPQGGNVGDILTRKADGAEWEVPSAVMLDINSLPEDTEITDNDQLIFYDISTQANRKIKPPNLLDSMCSDGTPYMNGTASAGTSKKPARYDHVHPTDTSRAPASYFQNNALKIANGGTAATSAAGARVNLGLSFEVGDSYEETLLIPNSGLFLNANAMYFTIVTPKSLENISTITVSKLTGAACGVSGAVENSSVTTDWTTMTGITLTAVKADGDHIRLLVQKTSNFTNGTAYTPVELCATFKFTFA